jgi:hypothetical protein
MVATDIGARRIATGAKSLLIYSLLLKSTPSRYALPSLIDHIDSVYLW